MKEAHHWADLYAQKIVERAEKKEYVCESGITPSGFVHVGNFREALTQNVVAEALRDAGKRAVHQHVWDSFDRFRKVPKGFPEEFEQYLGMPVSRVPDPKGCCKSMADHFIRKFEGELKALDMRTKFLYMHEWWEKCKFAENVKAALNERKKIAAIMNKYRREPLQRGWYPVMVYCEECSHDSTRVGGYDGEYKIKYSCKCGHASEFDFRKKGLLKLNWRVDWPSRWQFFDVDFEPSGKDHWAAGSSVDTGKQICKEVFNHEPPIQFPYEFISFKGTGGKMSSSAGGAITVGDLLRVYEPDMVKCFIVRTKANKEVAIPLDEDLITFYSYFDSLSRIYAEKGKADYEEEKLKRIYELSSVGKPKKPLNLPLTYAAIISQVAPSLKAAVESLQFTGHLPKHVNGDTKERVKCRLDAAKSWVETYAPEKYKIRFLSDAGRASKLLNPEQKKTLRKLAKVIDKKSTTKELQLKIYSAVKEAGKVQGAFEACYLALLGSPTGPRLANLIEAVGREKVIKRFSEV